MDRCRRPYHVLEPLRLLLLSASLVASGACDRGGASNSARGGGGESTPAATGSAGAAAPAAAAPGVFTDVAQSSGIDFKHTNGAAGKWRIFECMTAGGAFLDYDLDGDLDIFLTQSNDYDAPNPNITSRLYRNDGGKFADVTGASRMGLVAYALGCASADYDNDGDPDMYISCVGPDFLFRNNGDGTFADATSEARIKEDKFSSSAAWFDYDKDGFLDLYVARYCRGHLEPNKFCKSIGSEDIEYCGPKAYRQETDLLFHNRGDGTFEDVSAAMGIDKISGYGFAVICSDLDGNGWLDVYVACDQSPAKLWLNFDGTRFEECATQRGAAFDMNSVAIAGMGIVAEDFDMDDDFDLFVTNLVEKNALFLRNNGGYFEDCSARWGERSWLRSYTGFGVVAFDQDHNGRLDMFIACGAVQRPLRPQFHANPYYEVNVFIRQDEKGRFRDASAELGSVREPGLSRGIAVADYDEDGDMDVLVCRTNAAPQLLRNDQRGEGNWLLVDAVGADGRRPALNTVFTVEAGGQRWKREVRPHQSYLTTSDARVHFGIGKNDRIERVTARWLDGRVESWEGIAANQLLTLRYGTGITPGIR